MSADTGHDAGPLGPAVLQHHNDGTRAGLYVDLDFTKAAVLGIEPLPGFSFSYPSLSLIGSEAVFAQVLYESGAVKGADALFLATELDNVYALDPDTGATLWRRNVGKPATAGLFPTGCGSIYPLGITGTPIIDAASGTLFAVAMDSTSGVADYVVHALSVADGTSEWTLDLNAALGTLDPPFDSSVQMQRGALTIAGGVLYIPFGALAGACGSPYAWVVGVPLATPTAAAVKAWHPKTIGAGIWGPSGVATDGTSVYVGTSENTTLTESPDWSNDNSEALLRLGLDGGPTFTGALTDYYAPPDWFAQNAGGGQIGSSGTVLLDLPGSTPSTLAFVIGKTANASLVNRSNLGGVGGQLSFLPSATTDWVEGAMAAYTTASGTYVAVSAPGSQCAAGADLSTVKVVGGAPPSLASGWCAHAGGHGSPMVTASSVSATGVATDAVVWTIGTSHQGTPGNGLLTAFDGDTGATLVQPTTVMADVEHWISPIVVKGRMYVAGDKHVYAFDLKGTAHPSDAGPVPLQGDAATPPETCLIPVSNAQIDPCVRFGRSCQGNPQTSELGTCAAPTEGQACLPAVGCATGLSCLPQPVADGGTPVHVCYAPCNATTPCGNLSESCSATGDAGVCVGTSCSTYLGSCENAGASGTCLPFFGNSGEETGSCLRGGTLTTGTCASTGTAPASQLCAPGEYCATINGSACMPFCNALASAGLADAGPSCGAGLVCVPLFGPTTPAGLCAQPCGVDGGSLCPTSFTCEEWNGATGAKACFP